jgi:hypothetical protein
VADNSGGFSIAIKKGAVKGINHGENPGDNPDKQR